MASNYTLVVQDVEFDTVVGTLDSWEIDFVSSPCFPEYTWINITSEVLAVNGNDIPPARYGSHAVAFNEYFFIFGGRDENDNVLTDLHRFNTYTNQWVSLTPTDFYPALETASSIGSNFMLTVWGLLRYGGYYRQPYMTGMYDNYDSEFMVMDPVTLRWKDVVLSSDEEVAELLTSGTVGRRKPQSRYYAGAVFVSSNKIKWVKSLSYRQLYDMPIKSSHANYQGTISDSVLLFGGFDGATGSIFDGSSGGFLNDMWMLRLANWSTEGNRDRQQQHINNNCAWRNSVSGPNFGTYSCLGESGTVCTLRDLLLLPWCGNSNQTLS